MTRLTKITCAVLLCLSAQANSQPGDAGVTEAQLDAARALSQTLDLEAGLTAGFNAMTPMLDQLAARLELNAAEQQELLQIYRDWFEQDLDQAQMLDDIVMMYAEAFTMEEMRKLQAFYQTDLGQKVLDKMPELMARGARMGMQEAQSKEHLLRARLDPFIEQHRPERPAEQAHEQSGH